MNDLITTAFELIGLGCITSDCRALYRDRAVRGVAIWSRGAYGAWAAWNIVLFSQMHMPLSAIVAGISLAAYCIWLSLAISYERDARRSRGPNA